MPNLQENTKFIYCLNGNKEEFLKLLTALVYLDRSYCSNKISSYIVISCYLKKYFFYRRIHNDKIEIIIKNLCKDFQPRFDAAAAVGWRKEIPHENILIEKDYYLYFPTARERIELKSWLKDILNKRNISLYGIEEYLD